MDGFPNLKADDLLSPTAMSHFWNSEEYYQWQTDIANEVAKDGSRVIGTFPNEAGKTSVILADLGLYFMARYPGAQVVSTAGSFRQISEQLWPMVKSKTALYPEWKATEDKLTAPAIEGLRPSTWTIFSTDDPKKAEGYHTQTGVDAGRTRHKYPLIYMIDEAKSVDKGIFEAMYRCDPDHVFICSSPGEKDGAFYSLYDSIKRKVVEGWKLFEITWSDCPHLLIGRKRAVREQIIKMYGANHPFTQSMVFGHFFESQAMQIFKSESCRVAMSSTLPVFPGPRRCAVDLAGGGDEVVFGVRDGNHFHHMDVIVNKDTAQTSRWLESKFKQFEMSASDIVMDEGGLGQPIIDELEYRGWKGIYRYNFNDKPKDKVKYDSIAMEDHHRLSMMVDNGEVSLVNDEELLTQMLRRKYKMPNKNSNRMTLEPKLDYRKKWDNSPDRLDMLVMLFSGMNRVAPYPEAEKRMRSLNERYHADLERNRPRGVVSGVQALLKRKGIK